MSIERAGLFAALGLGVVALGYVLARKAAGDTRPPGQIIGEAVGRAVGSTAVSAAQGAAVGVVKGAGEAVGIPDTDEAKCSLAKLNGSAWEVSLYCPALEYFRWQFGGTGIDPPVVKDGTLQSGKYRDLIR